MNQTGDSIPAGKGCHGFSRQTVPVFAQRHDLVVAQHFSKENKGATHVTDRRHMCGMPGIWATICHGRCVFFAIKNDQVWRQRSADIPVHFFGAADHGYIPNTFSRMNAEPGTANDINAAFNQRLGQTGDKRYNAQTI